MIMLEKTYQIAEIQGVKTKVYFTEESDYTDSFDVFPFGFQIEGDLGTKMKKAFQEEFDSGAERVVIIGTDCPDNSQENIIKAFEELVSNDFVIGPSGDGGYYLLGMTEMTNEFFSNKEWSGPDVFGKTVQDMKELNKTYCILDRIDDIDYLKDLESSKYFKSILKVRER